MMSDNDISRKRLFNDRRQIIILVPTQIQCVWEWYGKVRVKVGNLSVGPGQV